MPRSPLVIPAKAGIPLFLTSRKAAQPPFLEFCCRAAAAEFFRAFARTRSALRGRSRNPYILSEE
jgi:hypothetical protein